MTIKAWEVNMIDPYETPIVKVLLHFKPDWEVPDDNGREWVKCFCPNHDEERPSASVSFEKNAVNCFACGYRGDVISIIRKEEGVTYGEAVRRAEAISGRSDFAVSRKRPRKSGRRVFGEARTDGGGNSRGGRPVPIWLRE